MAFLKHYPRLLLFAASCIAAFIALRAGMFDALHPFLSQLGILSALLGGMLFSFGFSAPFGMGIFLAIAPDIPIWIAAPVGGFGAFLSDVAIFQTLRVPFFALEVERLRSASLTRWLHSVFLHDGMSDRIHKFALWTMAGIFIASPLPDEIGVSLVSTLTNIESKRFALLSFLLNTAGIYSVLLIGRL